jgi:hypothetical protein
MTADLRWHFECLTCQYDNDEAGHLAPDDMIYCPLCLDDSGKVVLLRRWLSEPTTHKE